MNILFISKYDKIMASARYRVFFVSDILKKKYNYNTKIFVVEKFRKKFINSLNKKRIKFLSIMNKEKFDVVYFHKHFDKNIAKFYKKSNKKVLLSIDDLPGNNLLNIDIDLVDYVLCGSKFIQKLYDNRGFQTIFFPTLIPKKFLNVNSSIHQPLVLSWIGSTGGEEFILPILNELLKLREQYNVIFNIVTSSKMFDIKLIENYKFINFIEWEMSKEYKYFDDTDVVLMPLDKTERSRAKGGFKILQGMFRGCVSLAYDTEANRYYIKEYKNGFLYKTNKELFDKLDYILNMQKEDLINMKKFNLKVIEEKKLYLEHQVDKLLKYLEY